MAVLLNYLYGDKLPLRAVSDHISVVPKEGCTIVTTGWPKLLFFFNADPLICLSEGTRFTVGRGDTLILRGSNPIRFFPGAGIPETRLHVLAVYFEAPLHEVSRDDPRWDADLEEHLRATFTRSSLLRACDAPELWPLALRLRAECEDLQAHRQSIVCELARQWVLRIAELSGLQNGPGPTPDQRLISKAIAYLAAHDFQVTVPDMMRHLEVTSAILSKAFLEYTGQSPSRYLHWLSIEWAKLLLLQSNLSVVQVARRLRYGSTSAFCRAFQTRTGISPRGYRGIHDGTSTTWVAKTFSSADSGPFPAPRWQYCEGRVIPSAVSLLWCMEGRLSVRQLGKRALELSAEDSSMTILPVGKTCEVKFLEEQTTAILFAGPLEAERWPSGTELKKLPNLPSIRHLFKIEARNLHERLWIESHVRLLWLEILRQAGRKGRESSQTGPMKPSHKLLIRQACDFMQKHFRDGLSLDEIAHAVGVSGEHLARIFRAEHGQTVMNQLFTIRIYHAKKFLLCSGESLAHIAEECGFSTTSHFCRIFKGRTGLTPSEFRHRRVAEF